MRRPMPVTPRVVPAPSPVARRVVAIVAGTRIGLNMMKSGVDTANATAEQASVTPPKPKKTTEATEAITTLITSITGKRKENILPSLCNWVWAVSFWISSFIFSYGLVMGREKAFMELCGLRRARYTCMPHVKRLDYITYVTSHHIMASSTSFCHVFGTFSFL